ncbi:MAG: hypothetical protein OTI36_18800, partial [Beijerinckiaceae bacterium]|nr:hypothetical protein [Beijerinckiaceae bacterium]
MAIDTLRATQILAGADALLPNQTDTAAQAAAPAALVGLLDPTSSDTTDSGVSDTPLAAAANNVINTLHFQLEAAADQSGLIG